LNRLSLQCNFTGIKIPDGGSCCDWIAGAVILSESNSSIFATYLNTLRKHQNLENLIFGGNSEDIIQEIRLLYSASICYDYDPGVSELLNLDEENKDSLNELYCSVVLWLLKRLYSHDRGKVSNYTFHECVRRCISLTPSDVGKYGCMWGTDDFLHWFQRLYNIRVFVINIQTFDYNYTYGDFVNDGLVYEGTNDGKEKVHGNKNDKYFDLTDEDRLIPYGIIIVLMENAHFDTIFKLHGESSLIIPAGSQKVEFLLPYLQITPILWSSLNTDVIKDHNKKILDREKVDTFKDLNVWFDHAFAKERIGSMVNHFANILHHKKIQNTKSDLDSTVYSSVPFCSIRYSPKYVVSLIYCTALLHDSDCDTLVQCSESCLINLMESEETAESNFLEYLRLQI